MGRHSRYGWSVLVLLPWVSAATAFASVSGALRPAPAISAVPDPVALVPGHGPGPFRSDAAGRNEVQLLTPARDSLHDYGNCGGASLLDALARSFDHPRPGHAGLLWAVGRGFTTHALKARWVNGQRPVTTTRAKGN